MKKTKNKYIADTAIKNRYNFRLFLIKNTILMKKVINAIFSFEVIAKKKKRIDEFFFFVSRKYRNPIINAAPKLALCTSNQTAFCMP